jgi:hypothetical protein
MEFWTSMEEIANQVYKRSKGISAETDHYPIHQLQEDEGVNWIVICSKHDRVYDQTNSYFEVIRLPNGDIHLRLVDIFANQKNRNGRPATTTKLDDNRGCYYE